MSLGRISCTPTTNGLSSVRTFTKFIQTCVAWKCFTAFRFWTCEWFISDFFITMNFNMLSQSDISVDTLFCIHNIQMELLTGVNSSTYAYSETVLGWKRFFAFTTYEWLLTSMNFSMSILIHLLWKQIVAVRTCNWLLTSVNLHRVVSILWRENDINRRLDCQYRLLNSYRCPSIRPSVRPIWARPTVLPSTCPTARYFHSHFPLFNYLVRTR